MPTSTTQFFERDGLKLAVHCRPGEGIPILCIPGLTRNHRDFAHLLDQFPDRPIYRMDLRGRGFSDWDPQPDRYQPPTYAQDILAWLEQQQQVFDFVGTSLGGILTMAVASVQPQWINRAIINDVGPVIEYEGIRKIRHGGDRVMSFPSWQAAVDAVRIAQQDLHPRILEFTDFTRALCVQTGEQVRFDFDPAIFGQFGQGEVEPFWPLWEALAEKPTLIVHGEQSSLLSTKTTQQMLARHPKAEYLKVALTGHAPTLMESECVTKLHEFLA